MRKKERPKNPVVAVVPPAPAWCLTAGVALVVWVLFVIFKFDQKFPCSIDPSLQLIQEFLGFSFLKLAGVIGAYIKSVVLFAAIVTGSVGWGTRLGPSDIFEKLSSVGQFFLAMILGYTLLSMMVLAMGFLGFLSKPILYSFLCVFLASGVWVGRVRLQQWRESFRGWRFASVLDSPASWLMLILCVAAFVMAFVPELFYDSLVYHLGLPQMYVNEGRIVDTPYVYFSRAPMLIHMLYLFGVGLDGSILAKLFNWSLLMAGLGGIFELSSIMGWRKSGVWASLYMIAMPVVQLNVWSTAIDAAMGSFIVFATIILILWYQNPTDSVRWITLAGVLVGCEFGSKYTGAVTAIVFGVVTVAMMWKRLPFRLLFLGTAGFCVGSALIVAPYFVRNFVWTGNPFYPILSSVLESRHMNVDKMEYEKGVTQHGRLRSVREYLEYPWKLSFLELTSFNFIGPMMLAGLPLLIFLPWRGRKDVLFLFFATGFYFVFSLLFAGDIRYLLPGFFLLSVLLGGGLSVAGELKPIVGWFVKTVLVVATLYQSAWIFQCMQGLYHPADVLTGSLTRTEYSATMHDGLNLWPWNVMDAELRALPDSARVYILGNEQVFGFPKRFVYSSVHDDTPLVIWANESSSADQLLEKLKSEKLTHILINAPESVRLKNYKLYEWTPAGRRVFIDFANHHLHLALTKPIARYDNSLFLFEIQDTLAAREPIGNFGEFFRDVMNFKQP